MQARPTPCSRVVSHRRLFCLCMHSAGGSADANQDASCDDVPVSTPPRRAELGRHGSGAARCAPSSAPCPSDSRPGCCVWRMARGNWICVMSSKEAHQLSSNCLLALPLHSQPHLTASTAPDYCSCVSVKPPLVAGSRKSKPARMLFIHQYTPQLSLGEHFATPYTVPHTQPEGFLASQDFQSSWSVSVHRSSPSPTPLVLAPPASSSGHCDGSGLSNCHRFCKGRCACTSSVQC